ncbi:hypothetical protein BN1224_Wien1_A_00110 [Chlamydia pneumoniae]|uniref:Uncharacterized protein n=2 Tax=Chlamydia pneumoniae TaxID=83558 RepID=A0A0F7WHS3_CHLPN|nr:hypothetical protein BN1224_Wien1_A_00110 [Chlamydia pneumoniae]CRI39880.1 hypothetical protein CWL029c_A_00110 [Chlamydia pneumoniae]CRI45473.1 hypothetical protein BN1224_MUL2216_A_00100 [Chlamydia pneumoniae]
MPNPKEIAALNPGIPNVRKRAPEISKSIPKTKKVIAKTRSLDGEEIDPTECWGGGG